MDALSALTNNRTPAHPAGDVTMTCDTRTPQRLPWPHAALVVLGFCLLLWAGVLAALGAFMG
jgi:hypothetical protein